MAAYAGQYGARTIRFENGVLVVERAGREPTRLIPLAEDLFGFSNTTELRARFRRTEGKITGFEMITPDGQTLPVDRTA